MRHLVLAGVLMMGLRLSATPAQAQSNKNAFVGVSAVNIVVEDLSAAAAKCNVTESGLDAAARLPLDVSRLRINPEMSSTYVYVLVTVISISNGLCAASVGVSLKRALAIPGTNQLVFSARVWDKGSILSGASSEFGQRVNQLVGDFTKELISEWIKANPR